MSLQVTDTAAQHLQNQLAQQGAAQGIRLGVKASGCSGYMYVVDFVDSPSEKDTRLEFSGVPVFVDDLSMPLLETVEVDLVTEGLNKGLRFHNSAATSECGCGESFSV